MILVDDRAGSKDLLKHPPLSNPEVAIPTRLTSADVAFHGVNPSDPSTPLWIGVEVKSLFDLISSSDTGRLQATQIPAMLAEYDLSYLLYYGVHRPCPKTGHLQIKKKGKWTTYSLGTRPVYAKFVSSCLLGIGRAGMGVVHVPHVGKEAVRVTALEVAYLYDYWQKEKHGQFRCFDTTREMKEADYRRIAHGTKMPVPIDKAALQRAKFAAQFPGMGFERAVAAAGRFRSVEEMVLASEKEWAEVEGVGKVIARAVWETVRRKG